MCDEFPGAFSQTFHVRYDECGAAGTLRASVHLRFFQELAFAHSASLGFPLSWYEDRRLFWLLRRAHLILHAPARYGEALTCTTRIAGARRIMARRLNTARRAADGAPVATSAVDWILAADGTAPTRVPDEIARAFPSMNRRIVPAPLDDARPPEHASWTALWIRASDADAMGHANNAVYVDLLDDAVVRAGGRPLIEAHPRTYELEYHAAAGAGEMVRDVAWRDGRRWHYRLERPGGGLLLHGRLVDAAEPGDLSVAGGLST